MHNRFVKQSHLTGAFPKSLFIDLRMLLLISLLFLAFAVLGCESQSDQSKSLPKPDTKARGETDEGPMGYQKLTIHPVLEHAGNPLNRAMSLVAHTPTRHDLPHFNEAGYNLICNLPIVDIIQESPLQMPVWANDNSMRLQESARHGFGPLLTQLMSTLDFRYDAKAVSNNNTGESSSLDNVREKSFQAIDGKWSPKDWQAIASAGFTPTFEIMLGRLVRSVIVASEAVDWSLSDLSTEERRMLQAKPERYFFPDGDFFKFLTADTHRQVEIVSIAQKIDFPMLFRAALLMCRAVDQFVIEMDNLKKSDSFRYIFKDSRSPRGEILNISTPAGNLVILGEDNNRFTGEAALLIDLGGNDHYERLPTKKAETLSNVKVSIDLGGNDTYDDRRTILSQGAGSLSIGLMYDLKGNDKYQAGDMGQGCAFFGVGMLMDRDGNDIYHMGLMGQGFGLFGFGALADMDGNDRYVLKGMGQGAGATLGLGLLLDERGDDKYLAGGGRSRSRLIPDSMNHCQGAGLSIRSHTWVDELSIYGGIGFLSDGGGNDLYHSTGGNCMGSSYFMSLGALVDHGGNDIYLPEGGYGLGFGLHLSNGTLVDIKGDDLYIAGSFCGGFGSDRSVGILADLAGNDIYGPSDRYIDKQLQQKEDNRTTSEKTKNDNKERIRAAMANTSYGSALKPKAIGLLVDFQGSDEYFANPFGKGESIGGIIPPVYPGDWSHGIVVDLSGDDRYDYRGKQNGHYTIYYEHGICYDADIKAQYRIDELFLPNAINPDSKHVTSSVVTGAHPSRTLIDRMASNNLWERFRAKGSIPLNDSEMISLCTDTLTISKNNVLNRELFEILNVVLTKHRSTLEDKQIIDLLSAKSTRVKLAAVYLIGWQKLTTASEKLLALCNSDERPLRKAAFWALGRLAPCDSFNTLKKGTDPSQDDEIRREAYGSIANLLVMGSKNREACQGDLLKALANGLHDRDVIIKVKSIKGLKSYADQPQISEQIEAMLKDPNVYVRREAARAFSYSGKPEGIPVLIDSLQFPSIDTFEHYDHEIAKDLSFLCGVDFPDEKRYRYETWKQWWETNGHLINLAENLTIKDQIQKAFSMAELEPGLGMMEQLVARFPENEVVRNRYKRFCREWITFRLLNQAQVSALSIEKAIRLQQKLIALEPEYKPYTVQLNYLEKRLETMQHNPSRKLLSTDQ